MQLALNEYDDYDDGEMDDDDPDARGHADISQFSSVLSEFLDDKDIYSEKYETIAESRKAPGGAALGSGNADDSVGGGKTANVDMVVNVGVEDVVVKKTLELGDRHSDEGEELAVVEVESDEDRDDWDCETVVSTYSNFDNHPAKIGAPGLSKLRPKLHDVDKAGIIRLGGKQRLPVDYLPSGKGDEDKQDGRAVRKEAVSSGKVPTGPRAGETPAEKKARKVGHLITFVILFSSDLKKSCADCFMMLCWFVPLSAWSACFALLSIYCLALRGVRWLCLILSFDIK